MTSEGQLAFLGIAPADRWTHTFGWRTGPPAGYPNPVRAGLYGLRCRIVTTGRLGSALVEFEDGRQLVVGRRALRRVAA